MSHIYEFHCQYIHVQLKIKDNMRDRNNNPYAIVYRDKVSRVREIKVIVDS